MNLELHVLQGVFLELLDVNRQFGPIPGVIGCPPPASVYPPGQLLLLPHQATVQFPGRDLVEPSGPWFPLSCGVS